MALFLAAFWLAVQAISPPASAQSVQRIAAIVNDEVISMFDVTARVKLIFATSEIPDSLEARNRVGSQVLRNLVRERLQIQEAKRRNIKISQREIRNAFAQIEKSNKMQKGELLAFLKISQVPEFTLREQVRANLSWSKLVNRRFRTLLTVGEDEIAEYVDRLKKSLGITEYRLFEITLTIDDPNDESKIRQAAERLAVQLRQGANFSSLARQFSEAASAQRGGDLGWVRETELSKAVRPAVLNMKVGGVTEPIRGISSFHILQLINKRTGEKSAAADKGKVSLRQIFFPVAEGIPLAARQSQFELARTVAEMADGCDDMQALHAEVKSPRPVDLGTMALKDLAPVIRTAIAPLPIAKASTPVTIPGGLLVLMVCKRDVPKTRMPSTETVKRILRDKKLDRMSRRYLRDIRLSAIVDVRV